MCDGAGYVMGWCLSSDITEVNFILANPCALFWKSLY